MKKDYIFYSFISFVSGLFISFTFFDREGFPALVNMIHHVDMGYLNSDNLNLSQLIFILIPYVLFQSVFGTYIYRHFCSAAIYVFSRGFNKGIWYIKQLLELFMCSFFNAFLYISGVLFVHVLWGKDLEAGEDFLYETLIYLVILTLYMFVTSLLINVVAIISDSNIAFAVCQAVYLALAVFYLYPGSYHMNYALEMIDPEYAWMIEYNPFSYMVFNTRLIPTDYQASVDVFLILILVVSYAGYVVVKKREFVSTVNLS
ncbi:MAG: hypothetical protein K6F17_07835 [Lachnospiraceae bacterium]|nr:hypothetical protein [Lachnospiraceae bacterium]